MAFSLLILSNKCGCRVDMEGEGYRFIDNNGMDPPLYCI